MDLLKITVYLSLLVQIITGLFDYYVVRLNVPNKLIILQQLLIMELIVQIVEGIFYVWLALNIATVANITPHRYYDWYLTTPTMLVTLCVYLIYLRNDEENKVITDSLVKVVYDNLNILIPVVILNFKTPSIAIAPNNKTNLSSLICLIMSSIELLSSTEYTFTPYLTTGKVQTNNLSLDSNGLILFKHSCDKPSFISPLFN